MADRDALLSVFQGTIGALIGFLGVFGVYKATQRYERKRQEKERVLAGVVAIVEKSNKVGEIRLDNVQPILDLSHELLLFSFRGLPRRKRTAAWARVYSTYCATRPDVLNHENHEVLVELARISGRLIADLTNWVNRGCREGFLTEKKAKRDIKEIRATLHEKAPEMYEYVLRD